MMKFRLLAVLLVMALSATSSSALTRHLLTNITGANGTEICLNQMIWIKVITKETGRAIDGVDVDVYHGKDKIYNLLTDDNGFTEFNVSEEGLYRVSFQRTRYRETEEMINVSSCVIETTTTTTIEICPPIPPVSPQLEENCLDSGGTLLEESTAEGCPLPSECQCPGNIDENWTCLPITTTSTTTVSLREEAETYYNMSLGFYETGDYNNTKSYLEKACGIYENISDHESLVECRDLLKMAEEAMITTTSLAGKTAEAKNDRGWTWLLILIIVVLALAQLGRKSTKKATKLGGKKESIEVKKEGTKLGDL